MLPDVKNFLENPTNKNSTNLLCDPTKMHSVPIPLADFLVTINDSPDISDDYVEDDKDLDSKLWEPPTIEKSQF